MELAYVYIKEYRSFHNIELNFSQEVSINYDTNERNLTVRSKEHILPKGFWGDNINSLTMLVGNNGAGKTSLMQCVITLFQGMIERDEFSHNCIIVLREGKKLYYCGKTIDDISVHGNDIFQFEKIVPSKMSEIFVESKLIYLTNALSLDDIKRCQQRYYGRNSYLYDCSIGGLISSDTRIDVNGEARRHKGDFAEVEAYFQYEQYKQVKFVFDKNQHQILKDMRKEKYPVPLPQKLYIELATKSQLESFFGDDELSDVIKACLFRRFGQETFEQNISREILVRGVLQYLFCSACLWGMIRSIVRRVGVLQYPNIKKVLEEGFKKKEQSESKFCEVSDKIWRICEQFISSIKLSPDNDWDEFRSRVKPYYNIFFQYIENEAHLETYMKIETPFEQLKNNICQVGKIRLSVSTTENTSWFIEFINKYRYVANPDYFLNFQWGLSSGENNLLSMFASFYYIFGADYTSNRNGEYTIYNDTDEKNGINVIANEESLVTHTKCDNIILLIDEADLTYHPEWQREYISLLTAFLVRVYPSSCCKNIQIILSTHSPILLGDIPRQNVIYLKADSDQHNTKVDNIVQLGTFGQNIHLLLQNSFFLKNGTMGRFAYNKINNIFQKLSELENNVKNMTMEEDMEEQTGQVVKQIEELRQYIDLIAEPIIKRKLNSLIKQIYGKLPQNEKVKYLSDEQLEEQLRLLQTEKDRRSHDK